MHFGAYRLNQSLERSMKDVIRLARSPLRSGTYNENVTNSDIEQAFRDVFRWIGEDPDRDGLRETPGRLVRAYQEYFAGYRQDPEQILRKTFEETDGYDEMVVLRGIPFESHCEHHVAPIIGRAWVAYVPDRRVVGISKLARVVEELTATGTDRGFAVKDR
jgi:GTP cyclohydrolase I